MEKSRIKPLLAALLLLGGLSFAGCEDDNKNPENDDNNVKIRVESVEWKSDLKEGKTVYLGDNSMNVANRMIILPQNASDQKQTFSSSNTSVASVSEHGQITPNEEGTTTITVTVDEKTANFLLSVIQKPEEPKIDVTGINIPDQDVSLLAGSTKSLLGLFTVMPENADNRSVSYESDDLEIATVSATGTISGIKEGTATITVTSNDNGDVTGTFNVTVEPFYGQYDRTGWSISIDPVPMVNDVAGRNPANALDGNNSTFFAIIKPGKDWSGANNTLGYTHFVVDMQSIKTVNYFRIQHRQVEGYQLRVWKFDKIEISDDGEVFTEVDTDVVVTGARDVSDITSPDVRFNECTGRYIRFYCTESADCFNLDSGFTFQLAEFYLGRAQ